MQFPSVKEENKKNQNNHNSTLCKKKSIISSKLACSFGLSSQYKYSSFYPCSISNTVSTKNALIHSSWKTILHKSPIMSSHDKKSVPFYPWPIDSNHKADYLNGFFPNPQFEPKNPLDRNWYNHVIGRIGNRRRTDQVSSDLKVN